MTREHERASPVPRVMELKLRQALKLHDFEVHYQPVVDTKTLRTVGYEALLRWQDQTGSTSPRQSLSRWLRSSVLCRNSAPGFLRDGVPRRLQLACRNCRGRECLDHAAARAKALSKLSKRPCAQRSFHRTGWSWR